uniref:UDP-N-acetylmuramoyl-tripeptide--D-alanyl-D-alanine ligase n=1 Tax=Chlorobium chlorochromatii (strain CaD3) TaxID=340177 RepID=Q3ANV7_CHLCH
MKATLQRNDLEAVGELVFHGEAPPSFELAEPHVVIDSREVSEGGLFVALHGERTDGHRYVNDVFQHGATWAMVNRSWYEAEGHPLPPHHKGFLVVEDTVAGLQHLAVRYRNTFSIPIVAIGGSNGKTTTKEMVAAVLASDSSAVSMSQGNRNNHLGVPLTLLQMRHSTERAVVEVGINHPNEMAMLAELVAPTHLLLTNIGHEHLEFLGDLDGVAKAETQLYDYARQHGATAFINADDERLRAAAEGMPFRIDYSLHEAVDSLVWAEDVTVERDGRLSFLLVTKGRSEQERLRLHFTGRHNVLNAVAAATVGLQFGISLHHICEGLAGLQPAPGWKRLEVVEVGGVRLLNDTYNANSDSMRRAIDALCDMPCNGRRIAVVGDMLELGDAAEVEHQAVAHYIQRSLVTKLFTFGTQAAAICRHAPELCYGSYSEHSALLDDLLHVLSEGDVVLVKGSRGMRLELIVDGVVHALQPKS